MSFFSKIVILYLLLHVLLYFIEQIYNHMCIFDLNVINYIRIILFGQNAFCNQIKIVSIKLQQMLFDSMLKQLHYVLNLLFNMLDSHT